MKPALSVLALSLCLSSAARADSFTWMKIDDLANPAACVAEFTKLEDESRDFAKKMVAQNRPLALDADRKHVQSFHTWQNSLGQDEATALREYGLIRSGKRKIAKPQGPPAVILEQKIDRIKEDLKSNAVSIAAAIFDHGEQYKCRKKPNVGSNQIECVEILVKKSDRKAGRRVFVELRDAFGLELVVTTEYPAPKGASPDPAHLFRVETKIDILTMQRKTEAYFGDSAALKIGGGKLGATLGYVAPHFSASDDENTIVDKYVKSKLRRHALDLAMSEDKTQPCTLKTTGGKDGGEAQVNDGNKKQVPSKKTKQNNAKKEEQPAKTVK